MDFTTGFYDSLYVCVIKHSTNLYLACVTNYYKLSYHMNIASMYFVNS